MLQIGQYTHLLPICHRNSWYMAWDGHWAHTRDWQRITSTITEDTRETTFLFHPTPLHGSAKRKCGFFPQHHGNSVNCRCNHNFVCLAWFSCLRLCAGGIKITTIILIMQPCVRCTATVGGHHRKTLRIIRKYTRALYEVRSQPAVWQYVNRPQ